MTEDLILKEIHEYRKKMDKKFKNREDLLIKHIRKIESRFQNRLVSRSPKKTIRKKVA